MADLRSERERRLDRDWRVKRAGVPPILNIIFSKNESNDNNEKNKMLLSNNSETNLTVNIEMEKQESWSLLLYPQY